MLTRGNIYVRGKVMGLKRDTYGNAIGSMNDNPIIDTREYHVDFDDGEVRKLTANVIAESMYDACDDGGNEYLMMESIVEYQNNDKDITVPDKKVVHRYWSFMRRSTVGWQLCVQWRDGSISWQTLKDTNELNPVKTAENYMAQEIDHNPAFN